MSLKPLKVAVIGNIAAGKTLLCDNIVAEYGTLAQVVMEPVNSWIECGALEAYYQAKLRADEDEVKVVTQWAFQMGVLVSRMAQIRRANLQSGNLSVLVFDGHPLSDPAFTSSYISHTTVNYRKWYEQVHADVLEAEDCRLDLLVYVATPPEVCFTQKKLRDRSEESELELSYLQQLHAAFGEVFDRYHQVGCAKLKVYNNGVMNQNEALRAIMSKIRECQRISSMVDDTDSNL